MRSFVSSILILMILASQVLCAEHTHFGFTSEPTATKSGRPHFHVHGSHSHKSHNHAPGHRHNPKPELSAVTGEPFPLHDSDAWYFPDSVSSTSRRLTTTNAIDCLLRHLAASFSEIIVPVESPGIDVRPDSARQWSTARIPLYLRSLAIRC